MSIRPETDALIAFLDELAKLDPAFMGRLFSARVACNDSILHHPTVQAAHAKLYKSARRTHNRPAAIDAMPDEQGVAGILGVLNGFCGVIDDGPKAGYGPITIVVEDDGTVSSVHRTDSPDPAGALRDAT